MRVMVTGAAGYLGRIIATRLAANHELTLVDLDGVSGGRKDGGGPTVGKVFLTFRFDTVFTSK